MSPAISKTNKVQIFTDRTLKELTLLYSWKGPSQWKQSLNSKEKDDSEVFRCLTCEKKVHVNTHRV